MSQQTICDKCKKVIQEARKSLGLNTNNPAEYKKWDLCENCFETLKRVLVEYLPQ